MKRRISGEKKWQWTNNDKFKAISTGTTSVLTTVTTVTNDGDAISNTPPDLKTDNDAIITVPNENDVKETINTDTTTSE